MPSAYKGFRCFPLTFQHLNTSSTGVTVEYENDGVTPTGRLLINDSFAGFYPNSKYGVKALLEDTLAPLADSTINGVGWSLDTELYTRLNALDGNDPAYEKFKEENPLLWTPSTQTLPNGNIAPKSVKLIPCSYVYAMFFKHTTGHKLMVAYNYVAMHSYNSEYKSNGGYNDAGWLVKHIHQQVRGYTPETDSGMYTRIGGFMMSMIPPANPGETQEDWHPEFSIRSENFYPDTMFPIVAQFAPNNYYDVNYSSYTLNSYAGASLIRQGTDETYNSSQYNSKGIVVGSRSKTAVLADTKGNVGLCSHHNYMYDSAPLIILGPLYKKKIYDYDSLSTRYLACINYHMSRSYTSSTSDQFAYCAWYSTVQSQDYIFHLNTSGVNTYGTSYAAYPAMSNDVYASYRYSKAVYTTLGLIDEEVIRVSATDGLIRGQTFNDGEWCYITGVGTNTSPTTPVLYMSIRWDNAFNGTKTFVL